jgi:thiamine biosynthesis lipoprotein
MGGDASIILDGFTGVQADALIQAARRELSRLEQIFSLHIPTSDIVRLNRTGSLSPAPEELLEALGLAADLNQKSNGAFDPTVQALWDVHAQCLAAGETSPAEAVLQAARARVGFHHVEISNKSIHLNAGAALTLNGVAQGIMTDRIAALFRRAGAHHTLINLGEFRANGPQQDGTPWRVGLRNPSSVWKLDGRVEMTQGALATSAGTGHRLGGGHHLFNPRSGTSPTHYSSVSVFAPSAALADGLSTALYVLVKP